MDGLRQRAPGGREITYIFSSAVFFVFTWAVRGFFHQLPSLLLYFQAGEWLGILAYLMAAALVESLAFSALLVLAAVILPSRWFRDGFAYKGFLTLVVCGAAAIKIQDYPTYMIPAPGVLLGGAVGAIAILVLLILLVQAAPVVQKFILSFLDRLQVFAYVYIPIGILGMLVALVRNVM